MSAGPRLSLVVQNVSGATDLPVASTLRRWLERALFRLPGAPEAEVTVRFVGTPEGRALNREYRGHDHATNVLTFSYEVAKMKGSRGTPGRRRQVAGDLVLCVPVLRREARAQGKTLRAHCAHLVIHGALHLAGHDHQKAKDAKVMEALETGMLDSLGYDDPYATIRRSSNRIR